MYFVDFCIHKVNLKAHITGHYLAYRYLGAQHHLLFHLGSVTLQNLNVSTHYTAVISWSFCLQHVTGQKQGYQTLKKISAFIIFLPDWNFRLNHTMMSLLLWYSAKNLFYATTRHLQTLSNSHHVQNYFWFTAENFTTTVTICNLICPAVPH